MLSFALLGAAAAYNATTTVDATSYFTTYCSTPTTFAYGGSTYTVSEATTLTISDCSCTEGAKATSPAAPSVAAESSSTAPVLANGAGAAKVGAAAGVAAAVAYML